MDRRRAAGGILLFILAGLLFAEALGPYSAVSLEFSASLALVAVISAVGGIFLLQTAAVRGSLDDHGMPATVENPHRPPPVRSPLLPVSTGHGGIAPIGGGVTYPEPEGDEEKRDEPD